MDVYRGLLDTEIGLEVYNIGTGSSTKASGEKPLEVHGADKPLDPNLKPEHWSRSKLPSIVGSGSPSKFPKKTKTPERSPKKSVTISEQPPKEIPRLNFGPGSIHIPDNVNPKTHTSKGAPIPTSRSLPSISPISNMAPRRVLSSIPEENEGENIVGIELLRRKYRKALNPTPIEGIDVGDNEEVLDP